MEDIVALVKEKNRIEDVLEADGYALDGRSGRYQRCRDHDSLVVDTSNGAYFWNSTGERGDVINWVMNRRRCDFKTAVEFLCERARIERPHWDQADASVRVAARRKIDAYALAASIFARWLRGSTDALDYAHNRGWTDETIRDGMLGYTGVGSNRKALVQEMRGELTTGGIDCDDPAVVALTGFQGDVAGWGRKHDLKMRKEWIEQGYVPGLVARGMLVYPHIQGGHVVYFSGRGVQEKKHYNLPVELAGERKIYLSTNWSPREKECVIVEGQADAVTLGQWGIPAVALAGVSADANIGDLLAGISKVYVALDADHAGQANLSAVCEAVSPLTRVLRWPEIGGVKDANDLLKYWNEENKTNEQQLSLVRGMQMNSISYLEELAAQCGKMKDATDRDNLELDVMKQYIRLDEMQQAQYRDRVATALNRKMRDFDRLVKQLLGQAKATDDNKPDKIVPIWGGYHDGYLFEYLFDPEDRTAMLAYREPDDEQGKHGKISRAAFVDVWVNGERIRYVPEEPYDFIFNGTVLFPSNLGEHREERELVGIIESFLKLYYLFDDSKLPRIIAYYVMMTWLYDAFNAVSYLRALGDAGSGKSELMRRIGAVCYRMVNSGGVDTSAVLFRTIQEFSGTLVIDEYDQQDSDTTNDFVKILNMGAMKDGNVTRMTEYVDVNGVKKMRPMSFSTYCPKLLNGRRDMKDDAIGTRCLTFRLMPHVQLELMEADIPLSIDDEFRKRAMAIRNLLVRWRLEKWQEEIEIKREDLDPEISPRLNQVTVPMKAIARLSGDEAVKTDLTALLREMYAQEVMARSDSLNARVVEALWKIFVYPDLSKKYLLRSEIGTLYLYPGSVAEVTNDLIDKMNSAGQEEDDDKKGDAKVHPRKIGTIMRDDLQLRALPRKNLGIPYVWSDIKMISHALRYGVDWRTVLAHVLAKNKPEDLMPEVLALAEKHKVQPKAEETLMEKAEKMVEDTQQGRLSL